MISLEKCEQPIEEDGVVQVVKTYAGDHVRGSKSMPADILYVLLRFLRLNTLPSASSIDMALMLANWQEYEVYKSQISTGTSPKNPDHDERVPV